MSAQKRIARRVPSVTVKLIRLEHGADLPTPEYQTPLSAGIDLLAAVPKHAPVTLKPGERALVPTGIIFEIPKGFEGQVRPRSGLALKHGISVLNSPGTIDADYRGEVSVLLINLGNKQFKVRRAERIAQLIIAPVTQAKLKETKTTSKTKRGSGGFGSTGLKAKPKAVRNLAAKKKAKTISKRK